MRDRIIVLLLFIFLIGRSGYSQDNDFGIWYGINSEFSINKKLELDVSAMIRTLNNASTIEQSFLEGGLSYKFNKFLAVTGSYRLINSLEDDSKFHIRHKFLTDVKGSVSLNRFSFSARMRMQIQVRTFSEDGDTRSHDLTGRIKLKGSYNIPKFPVDPYCSIETFSPLFESAERIIGKERFAAGFEYKIVKGHSIEAEYIFERDFLPHLSDINIISIGYNVKF